MPNTPWSTKEIQSAIIAYFKLLEAQKNNAPTNKAEIYRKLNKPVKGTEGFKIDQHA